MHVGTRPPIEQVIHEFLHTRGSGHKTHTQPRTLIGSDPDAPPPFTARIALVPRAPTSLSARAELLLPTRR